MAAGTLQTKAVDIMLDGFDLIVIRTSLRNDDLVAVHEIKAFYFL